MVSEIPEGVSVYQKWQNTYGCSKKTWEQGEEEEKSNGLFICDETEVRKKVKEELEKL